jgi:hypothetical protein
MRPAAKDTHNVQVATHSYLLEFLLQLAELLYGIQRAAIVGGGA